MSSNTEYNKTVKKMKLYEFNYEGKSIGIWLENEDEHIQSHIKKRSGFYEIEFLEWVRERYPKGRGIVDIGANIGNHTLYFETQLEYQTVYSFEAHIDNFKLLEKNSKGNHYHIALADKEGESILWNSEAGNCGGYSLHQQPRSFVVEETQKTRTLDSYHLNDIDLIKIDVEGGEEGVLEGSKETIERNRPVILIENLGRGWPDIFDKNRLNPILENMGYKKEGELMAYMDWWITK